MMEDGRRHPRGVAEGEMERESYRHLSANKQRAEKGKGWGPRAFGYNGDHEDPALVINEADAVREAYHDFLAGESLYAIAVQWNDAGFRTNKGNEWEGTTIKRLLANPRYAGLRAYKGEVMYKDGDEAAGTTQCWQERLPCGGSVRWSLHVGLDRERRHL
jgi:Recombinase